MNASTLRGFAVLGLCSAFAAVAHAIPQLRISDGITTITITDAGVGDQTSAPGAATWIGSIGTWSVNVVTGITKPTLGYADLPIMNLGFTNTSSGAGTLTLMFTETGFIAPMGGWTNQSFGGTTTGLVTYDIYGAASGSTRNVAFDTTRHLGTLGPASGAFSGKDAKNYLYTNDPFSLTQVITITHGGAGVTSGSAFLRVPEGGASILLLLGGLTSLGLLRRFFGPLA